MTDRGMRILVAGANGQLGSDCLEVLADGEVFGLDLPDLDIADAASVRSAFSDVRPDVVVNCAAYTAVDRAESDEAAADRVNREGPGVLAAACAATGARLVHISTDYVFSGDRPVPEPWLESDEPAPRTAYGRTKLAGERAIAASGCDHAILRTAWLYGARGRNFPKTMLRLALKNPADTARVVADQWGCPTWSWRLAEQIRAVIDHPGRVSGVCHAVGLGSATWFEFAEAFLSLVDVRHRLTPCETADYPTPAHRPANSILDCGKLRAAGLLVMDGWRDALAAFVAKNRDALLAECSPS